LSPVTEGKLRLAAHLAEMAVAAAPDDRAAHAARAEVFEKFADSEPSVMAKGIYRWAANESTAKLESDPNESTGP